MKSNCLLRAAGVAFAFTMACAPVSLVAQEAAYPAKPIRFVVPFPPGGATDVIARLLAQKMGESMGQTVFVDNRAGASGTIGSDFVAKAAPDGYTILMGTTSSHSVAPATSFVRVPYDNVKDFAPVSMVATYPNVLLVPANGPANVNDLIAQLKKPGSYSFGSSGTGTSTHLTGELFKLRTQINATHVPYKGTTPMLNDLVAGTVTFGFDQLSAVMPLVESGRLRALAVTSTAVNPALPGVPALADTLPGFEADAWIALFTSPGTPAPIVSKLQAEVKKALAQADLQKRLKDLGASAKPSTPAELTTYMQADTQKWRGLVKAANLKPD
jgi:tripartite-type tricarboxylate transporter receptor subunit TctC